MIVIPLADVAAWIAEVYVAVTAACADHAGDHQALAGIEHSGRIILDRVAPPQPAS